MILLAIFSLLKLECMLTSDVGNVTIHTVVNNLQDNKYFHLELKKLKFVKWVDKLKINFVKL